MVILIITFYASGKQSGTLHFDATYGWSQKIATFCTSQYLYVRVIKTLTANTSNRLKKYDAFWSSGVFKDPKYGLRVNYIISMVTTCFTLALLPTLSPNLDVVRLPASRSVSQYGATSVTV